MRIAITSAWNRAYQPIADITVPVMLEYAKFHGYSFRGWPDRYHTDEQRDPSFLYDQGFTQCGFHKQADATGGFWAKR